MLPEDTSILKIKFVGYHRRKFMGKKNKTMQKTRGMRRWPRKERRKMLSF